VVTIDLADYREIILFHISLFKEHFWSGYYQRQKGGIKPTVYLTQPNDTEIDTPTERKIKVECLNRFHLISLQN